MLPAVLTSSGSKTRAHNWRRSQYLLYRTTADALQLSHFQDHHIHFQLSLLVFDRRLLNWSVRTLLGSSSADMCFWHSSLTPICSFEWRAGAGGGGGWRKTLLAAAGGGGLIPSATEVCQLVLFISETPLLSEAQPAASASAP